MKRTTCALVICTLVAGCAGEDLDDPVEVVAGALNGTLITDSNLTRKSFTQNDETIRKSDTDSYYDAVGVLPNGLKVGTLPNGSFVSNATIKQKLPTLATFKSFYGFPSGEAVAYYYNRGDLGIGREMHCKDKSDTTGEIICYVRNFFGGDADKEFAFGLNSSNAFANMAANNSFATVAMVYRKNAAAANKVFFVVYGANDGITDDASIQNFAALDRHGFEIANGRLSGTPGGPGGNYNNHIPTNCIACHGGSATYSTSSHSVTGALFLPFDLDQFEYDDSVSAHNRPNQLGAFKALNQMVRKVATLDSTPIPGGVNIRDQLDTWYQPNAGDPNVFESSFAANIPSGWNTDQVARDAYTSAVRGFCRSCHVSQATVPFNSEGDFNALSGSWVPDLCNFSMPHALQTVREFWQSGAPTALVKYLNDRSKMTDAATLANCGTQNVVTLDPPMIQASTISAGL